MYYYEITLPSPSEKKHYPNCLKCNKKAINEFDKFSRIFCNFI